MSEEKQKNDEVIERQLERFGYVALGFVLALPVALWVMGHLFYLRDEFIFTEGALKPALQCLDTLFTGLLVFAGLSLIYIAGRYKVLEEIVKEELQ